MNFSALPLAGAYVIDVERQLDERGFFARTYCADDFAARGLGPELRQCSVSYNSVKGTLRGMHYQATPHEEHKLVRCTGGAIFDVIVDLREGSATYRRWFGTELSAENRRALFVPPGFAHGFITLARDSEVFYMISAPYAPGFGRGVRWDDPAFAIDWPSAPTVIAARDAAYPFV